MVQKIKKINNLPYVVCFIETAILKWVAYEVWNELRRGLGLSKKLKNIGKSDRLPRIIELRAVSEDF